MASKEDDDDLLICEVVDPMFERDSLLNHNNDTDDEVLLNDRASQQQPRRRRIRFEVALQHTGFGRFQFKLLCLCGWALCGCAIQCLSASVILRIATCELQLIGLQRIWFQTIIYFGMIVGGLLLASLADWHGRKTVLMIALGLSTVFSLATSFAQDVTQFLAFRFFAGVGLGGSIPTIFSYFAEFQSQPRRGTMLASLGAFWVIGTIIISGLGWLMIPFTFGIETEYFRYGSWHIILSLSSIPSLTAVVLFFLMPESPKYLTENGRDEEAYVVLENMFNDNHPHLLPSEFENYVDPLIWNIDHMNFCVDSARIIPKGQSVAESFRSFWRVYAKIAQSWVRLVYAPYRLSTVVMMAIFFLISFGYYGFLTWFSEAFIRFRDLEKSGGTFCAPFNSTSSALDPSQPCVPSEISLRNKFLINVVAVPGCVLTILLADQIRRKYLFMGGLLVSSAVCFFVWLISTDSGALAFCCVLNGFVVIGWNTLNILAVELFPTNSRCTAFGLLTALSSSAVIVGIAVFETLVLENCFIPVLIMVLLFVMCGSSSCLLPDAHLFDLM